MITANVWERVVRVTSGDGTGTGFVIDRDTMQYVVTARHVVGEHEHPEIRLRGNLVEAQTERLVVPSAAADVAVYRLSEPIVEGFSLPADGSEFLFGQDAYFLGYPLGMTFDIGHPEYFPLVKRATLSGRTSLSPDRPVLLLDGWNNPGFSGGPVVFRPLSARGLHEPMKVCGIITAYRRELFGVQHWGQQVAGAEVLGNSGVIIAEDISRAIEAIDAT